MSELFIYSISIHVPRTVWGQEYWDEQDMARGTNKLLAFIEVLLLSSGLSAIVEECKEVEKAPKWTWPTWFEGETAREEDFTEEVMLRFWKTSLVAPQPKDRSHVHISASSTFTQQTFVKTLLFDGGGEGT